MAKCFITTIDNPYDPISDYDAWHNEDMRLGYNSEAYLARIALMFYNYNDDLEDEEKDKIIEQSIDDIIQYDFMNIYKKIRKETQY